jgi:hypothetical protein
MTARGVIDGSEAGETGWRKTMKKESAAAAVLSAVFFLSALPAVTALFSCPVAAYAQDDWKKEFDELCGTTHDVMAFSRAELKGMIERCDKLKPDIENLGDTERRVYLKRLQLCRNLFSYALEIKEKR